MQISATEKYLFKDKIDIAGIITGTAVFILINAPSLINAASLINAPSTFCREKVLV